jgi:hypothetical protein
MLVLNKKIGGKSSLKMFAKLARGGQNILNVLTYESFQLACHIGKHIKRFSENPFFDTTFLKAVVRNQ